MVLVNAVYFKGLWLNQFDESDTHDQEFWISAEESVQVPMMHIKKKFRYFNHRDLDSTILAMDYKVRNGLLLQCYYAMNKLLFPIISLLKN